MTSAELYRAGQLGAAIEALTKELRDNPQDVQRRTFLFELLCFAGDYHRAEQHLDILSAGAPDAAAGALVYRAALEAERTRHDLFTRKKYPDVPAGTRRVEGTLNGKPFQMLEDADPRIGPRLEIFAAGKCVWLPFEHISAIEMGPPKLLRDLLWARAAVRTGPEFKSFEFDEALIPALYPFSYRHKDENVRLGRATVWEQLSTGEIVPFGQKMFLVDGEEFPFLELRSLEITAAAPAADAAIAE
jgi:type VI secretion system protein ImpE